MLAKLPHLTLHDLNIRDILKEEQIIIKNAADNSQLFLIKNHPIMNNSQPGLHSFQPPQSMA